MLQDMQDRQDLNSVILLGSGINSLMPYLGEITNIETGLTVVPVEGYTRSGKSTCIAYCSYLPMREHITTGENFVSINGEDPRIQQPINECPVEYGPNDNDFIPIPKIDYKTGKPTILTIDGLYPTEKGLCHIPKIGHSLKSETIYPKAFFPMLGNGQHLKHQLLDMPGGGENRATALRVITPIAREYALKSAESIPALIYNISYDDLNMHNLANFRKNFNIILSTELNHIKSYRS